MSNSNNAWDAFLGKPIQSMEPEEQEYAAMEIKRAANSIINQNRHKSPDWFVGVSLLLQEEGRVRQAKAGSAQ